MAHGVATGLGSAEAPMPPSRHGPTGAIPCANGFRTMLLHGSVRHGSTSPSGHPADGMTAHVEHGDGAVSTIIDPRCFDDGGPEWVMRYGNPEAIRYAVASLLASYDYLLSGHITQREAIKRLMLMRRARSAIAMARNSAETACPAPVPQDCQARAASIAQPQSPTPKGLSTGGEGDLASTKNTGGSDNG